jgi:hypothetical protein
MHEVVLSRKPDPLQALLASLRSLLAARVSGECDPTPGSEQQQRQQQQGGTGAGRAACGGGEGEVRGWSWSS